MKPSPWSIARVSIIVGLVLCAVLSVPRSDARAESEDLQHWLDGARVVRNYELPPGDIKSISTGDGRVAVLTVSPESSYVALYEEVAHEVFIHRRANKGHRAIAWMTLCEAGNVLSMLDETDTPWEWQATALDSAGHQLFQVPSSTPLLPSPAGQFFVPDYNDEQRPMFDVYDRQGVPVGVPLDPHGDWRARFVSDSVLATVTRDSLWLVNVRSGQRISAQSFGYGMFDAVPNLKSGGAPRMLAVYDYHSLGFYTEDGTQIWHEGFGDCLGGVTLDPNGGTVVLQVFQLATRDGYLESIDVNDPEAGLRSESLAMIDNCIFRSDEVSWLRDGLYLFLSPATAEMYNINDFQDYETVFVDFGQAGDAVTGPVVLHGIFAPVAESEDAALLHLVDKRHLTLTQLPAWKQ